MLVRCSRAFSPLDPVYIQWSPLPAFRPTRQEVISGCYVPNEHSSIQASTTGRPKTC